MSERVYTLENHKGNLRVLKFGFVQIFFYVYVMLVYLLTDALY